MSRVFKTISPAACATVLLLCATSALAAGPAAGVDGAQFSAWWSLPFVCMLLSIALLPIALPYFWHEHYGKVAVFWALAFVVPFALLHGFQAALGELLHTLLLEYIPFLILLFALFTVSGGIRVTGSLSGTPLANVAILALGAVCSSLMGTTGASMLFIRPLLQANEHRTYKAHSVIFFIFLVSNIGGALTPIGDPPLFLGFLKGVHFFWTTEHVLKETLFAIVVLLGLYYCIDRRLYAREGKPSKDENDISKLGLEGRVNFLLLGAVVGLVLLSGFWKPGVVFSLGHVEIALQDLVRDLLLLGVAGLSLALTPKTTRELNNFEWGPIIEVAKIFFGIFISMIPAIALLKAGENGALSSVISLVSRDGQPVNHMYFWLSGILSSFLDNAPTYLVFFNTAGGDAHQLMNALPSTLAAISCGSVFMGANSYIGNAPNFMVRSIAESQGVQMPSFIGYMSWSISVLIPLFLIETFLFF